MTARRPFHWSSNQKTITWRQAILLLVITSGLLTIFGALYQLKAEGASCYRHGVPAICRSPIIEQQAKALAMSKCKLCDPRKIAAAIYSLQMNEGPYESAKELAEDALRQ